MEQNIAIIGGGVQGLSCGWFLARRGMRVDLFDCQNCGEEASWAAAGMLSGSSGGHGNDSAAFRSLCVAAARLWQDFVTDLENASGMTVDYCRSGSLCLAFNNSEHAEWLHHRQKGVVLVRDEALLDMEPYLASDVFSAFYHPDDHHLDSRCVLQALRRAFVASGGVLHEHCAVEAVAVSDGAVEGIRLKQKQGQAGERGENFFASSYVVVAAGAWSGLLAGISESAQLRPIKGQMVALDMGTHRYVTHALWFSSCLRDLGDYFYMVPRRDGRLLLGATVEDVGFDKRVTAAAVYRILHAAFRVVPALESCAVVESWAGLRPMAVSQMPYVGALRDAPKGLLYACGHYRHGFLLAPYTAAEVTAQVMGDKRAALCIG